MTLSFLSARAFRGTSSSLEDMPFAQAGCPGPLSLLLYITKYLFLSLLVAGVDRAWMQCDGDVKACASAQSKATRLKTTVFSSCEG